MFKIKPRLTSLLSSFFWFILLLIWGILSANIFWDFIHPAGKIAPEEKAPVENGHNYLIIARENLEESAYEWARYREKDYHVKVEILDEPIVLGSEKMMNEVHQRASGLELDELEEKLPLIFDEILSESLEDEQDIKDIIQETYIQSGEPYPFYVLLIGSDDSGQLSYLSPYHYFLPEDKAEFLPFAEISGDSGYTFDEKNNLWLSIAIGRIPFNNNSAVLSKLESTQEYENNPINGFENAQMSIVASDAMWGDSFATLTELGIQNLIKTELSPDFNYQIINGNYKSPYSLPVAMYSPYIAKTLENRSLWFSYIGHGGGVMGPARISANKYATMFSLEDASLIENTENTIMTFVACMTDSLVRPLFNSATGTVATFSSSSITFAYPNTFLQKDLMLLLINDQIETVGEWTRLAKQGYFMPEMNRSFLFWFSQSYLDKILDLILGPDEEGNTVTEKDLINYQNYAYNLLGDPALRIAYPQRNLNIQGKPSFTLNDTKLTFSGESELKENTMLLVFLKHYPGNIPFTENSAQPNSLETFSTVNDFILNATTAKVNKNGDFNGEIEISVPTNGVYILEATSLSSPSSVGHDKIYVGLSGKFVFSSPKVWWLAILLILSMAIIKRNKK